MADTLTEQREDRGKQRERGETSRGAPEAATFSGMVTQADKARQGVTHSTGAEDPQSVRGWKGPAGIS